MGIHKNTPHAGFILLSLAAHFGALYTAVSPGVFDFGKPIAASQAVMVDLAAPSVSVPQSVPLPVPPRIAEAPAPVETSMQQRVVALMEPADELVEEQVQSESPSADEASHITPADDSPAAPPSVVQTLPKVVTSKPPRTAPVIQPPLRRTEEFLSLERETLSYQVNLRGVPVGSAVLEASSAGGEFRISLKMNSGPALSTLYPVHNQIETRHIGGNFIITKIRRQEGSRRSDNGFTISLRDRSVFWVDLLKRRSSMEKIPTSDVLDPFSALYYLRNRTLQVGKTEVLHVYDGDSYAELPVEVLRSELIHLPGKGDTQTLVLKPQLRNEAVFHRTGEMLVWVTADEFKVPVKVETSILLGKVTAELVAAETAPLPSSRPESLQ